jgi:hypothetical protein
LGCTAHEQLSVDVDISFKPSCNRPLSEDTGAAFADAGHPKTGSGIDPPHTTVILAACYSCNTVLTAFPDNTVAAGTGAAGAVTFARVLTPDAAIGGARRSAMDTVFAVAENSVAGAAV